MKIDLDTEINLSDGTPVMIAKDVRMTLGNTARGSINQLPQRENGERKPNPEEIVRRGRLAIRLATGGVQDFDLDDLAFIRKSVQAVVDHPETLVMVLDAFDTEVNDA